MNITYNLKVCYYESLTSQMKLISDRTSHMPKGTRSDINIVFTTIAN